MKIFMNRNIINIYRAISCEEKISIEKRLAFIPHADHMAGKWFAEKIDDAAKWGRLFYNWDKKPFFIVLIQLPKHIAELMIKHPRLNGIGPSRYAEGDVLKNVNESILSSNFGFSKRVMWVSVLVSDCPPDLEKPKLDDNIKD